MLESAWWSPQQFEHLKEWEHSSPCFVSNYGGFIFALALQHYANWQWCSDLWGPLYHMHLTLLLQTWDLRVGQKSKSCIGLTQENSIENSVQDYLLYIQIPNGLCKLFLAYPKWPCICLKVNMYFICFITSSFQNLLYPSMCHVTCDHVIWYDLLVMWRFGHE